MSEGNNDWNDSFKSGDLIRFEGDYGYVVKIEPHNTIYIKWFKHDGIYKYYTNTGYYTKYFIKKVT
jgi:signal peptidase I